MSADRRRILEAQDDSPVDASAAPAARPAGSLCQPGLRGSAARAGKGRRSRAGKDWPHRRLVARRRLARRRAASPSSGRVREAEARDAGGGEAGAEHGVRRNDGGPLQVCLCSAAAPIRLAGIEYHGQTSTSGHCAPANVLAVKDGLHKRMSRTKGGAFYNLVRKAGWGAFDGPIEVARKSAARMSVKEAALKDWSGLPRIQVHNWLNKNEKKDIAVKARANTAIVPHPPSAPRLSLSLSRPRSPGLELTHPRPSRRAPGAARTCSTRRSRRSTSRRAGKATRRSTCTRWRAPS